MTLDGELDRALAALAAGDDEAALEALVAAWNVARTARLIAPIDALAERVEARVEPIAGRTSNDRYDAFMAVFARRRQADLRRLVELVPRLAYGSDQTALDALLYDWPYTPRMTALLARVAIPHPDRVADLRAQHAELAAVELAAATAERLAAIDALIARGDASGDGLLAQVYADPSADEPRSIYADWLTTRGDPHGELIALQLARQAREPDAAAVRRELALLAANRHSWLGGLRAAVTSARFARGFPAAATVAPRELIATAACPAWSTVTAIELVDRGIAVATHELVARLRAMAALREVRGLNPDALFALGSASQLSHLGLVAHDIPFTDDDTAAVFRAAPRASWRSIGLRGEPRAWRRLLGHLVHVARVEVVDARFPRAPSAWLTEPLAASVVELDVLAHDWQLRFARGAAGGFDCVDASCGSGREPARRLRNALQLVPPGSLRAFVVRLPRRPDAATRERLERAARAQQPSLASFAIVESPALRLAP